MLGPRIKVNWMWTRRWGDGNRVNINILGISELKWMGMGKFNSDNHYYLLLWARIPKKKWGNPHNQQESEMQYLCANSKMTE